MILAKVPLTNQHELAAELWVFEDAGIALGKAYKWKHGAVLLWDGVRLEVRKISLRPSDHYLIVTIPKEGERGSPFFLRLHKAVAAAFHGLPRTPELLVRHRGDRRHGNSATDLTYGSAAENSVDYHRSRGRTRGRGRAVLIQAKTAREARSKLGLRGEGLNRLLDRLLKNHVAAG